MAGYDFTAIEKKWQDYWQANETFRQANPGEDGFVERDKLYVLDMFPYPSGVGLHVGHPLGYIATDIFCRYKRMRGFNVLHPMGYDSFGLPAEQYAVERGVHPRETTAANIDNMRRQFKGFGLSYDWSRELATTDVDYYRWTQWIFVQLFNSWYDPAVKAARPIAELVNDLVNENYLVDMGGNVAFGSPTNGTEAFAGTPAGLVSFNSLEPDQQHRLIDEYRLAYMAEAPVNWCPQLGTVLANEEVTNEGRSDRGNFPVYRRPLKQWMLRITAYADRLIEDLDLVDWPESIKLMQRNWIGRSSGAELDFPLESVDDDEWFAARAEGGYPSQPEADVIRVYTTRPDTLFGATYMVLAPEHPLVEQITTDEQRREVAAYVTAAARRSELERTADTKDKTGVFTGAYAINPVNRERVPVWVADYVMMGYGFGAIMAVPAHDTRDLEFAEQFGLPIIQVVDPGEGADWRGFVGEGKAVNSGKYDGQPTPDFIANITADLAEGGLGKSAINYKLRDWLFSRQRYWGEPFPIVHCDNCGMVALAADQLPLELPEMDDFSPATSDDPEAPPAPPLAKATDWVATACPSCGGDARRETNTMPQWAGSCWYYLRFCDAANDQAYVGAEAEKYWMGPNGVDLYVGGVEHAVLHLLYARFWHKVLFDLGHASTGEPFGKLFNQGYILASAYTDSRGMYVPAAEVDERDGKFFYEGEEVTQQHGKMGKSLKNAVDPDDIFVEYGCDTLRVYEMFMGPLEASKPWNMRDVPGSHRFCHRVWRMIAGDEDTAALLSEGQADENVERALHKVVKKVGEDIEAMKFNTAVAAMMEFVNVVYKAGAISTDQAERFVLILSPFTPHLCEELWQVLGRAESLAYEPWPSHDEAMIAEDTAELAVQVNGKMRGKITVAADADEETVIAAALGEEKVAAAVEGKQIVKKIVVPGRLVNFVVK